MQLAEHLDMRFDARSVDWFLRVFGLALVVDVLTEVLAGVWHVHTGQLYPWRHLGIVPLYPAPVLALEWTLRAGAGATLLVAAHRARAVAVALRIAAPVLFVAVLQRYSNHGVLLFLVALYSTIAPPDTASPSFTAAAHPALGLVRAQLVIVYVFSAINKLAHGFGTGESLANLFALPAGPARALSWGVVFAELALPLVLVRSPRLGIAAVVAIHVAFAAVVPGVVSFGLVMIAMALLFVRSDRVAESDSSSG